MSVFEVSNQDGVAFARSIRALALGARDVLEGHSDEMDVQNLLDRIESLEEEAQARGTESISRWLTSLRRLVEDQVMASA